MCVYVYVHKCVQRGKMAIFDKTWPWVPWGFIILFFSVLVAFHNFKRCGQGCRKVKKDSRQILEQEKGILKNKNKTRRQMERNTLVVERTIRLQRLLVQILHKSCKPLSAVHLTIPIYFCDLLDQREERPFEAKLT